MYGQMPGGPGADAFSRIKHTLQMPSAEAQKRLSPGALPAKPQGGAQAAMNAGTQFANLYKSGKGIKGDIETLFKDEGKKDRQNKGPDAPKSTARVPEDGAGAAPPADARTELQAGSQQASLEDQNGNAGLAPRLASAQIGSNPGDLGDKEDLLSMFTARGGRINRYAGGRAHFAGGGPGRLPAGLAPEGGIDIPDEMPGYKLNEGLPKGGGGGGGGGGGLGSALGAVGTAVSVASTVAKILPFLAGLSDKRVKQNKEPIGELFDGQKVYRYDFGDGRTEIGLMAQEVEKRHPSAVSSIGGLKFVDYEKAVSRVKKQVGGGLGDILGLDEERRVEPVAEEERDLNQRRTQLAALQQAEGGLGAGATTSRVTMSDADPIGLGGGAPAQALKGGLGGGQSDLLDAARAAARGTFGGEATGLDPVQVASVDPNRSATPRGGPAVVSPSEPARDEDRVAKREEIIQEFLPYNRQRESGNRNVPNQAGTSGAFGPHQFIKDTWAGLIRKHPDLRDLTPADRFNEDAQNRVAPYYARDIANAMERSGVDVSKESLRAGWFLGEKVGPTFMKALASDPNTPAIQLAGRAAIEANHSIFFDKEGNPRTAEQALKMLTGGGGGGGGGDKPSPVDRATQVAFRATQGPWEKIGEKAGVPEMMRDERVFVPLLAGIGSMLASDKPRFSQALGEGLAGAAGAYGAVRGQTEEIAESRGRQALTKAQTTAARFVKVGDRTVLAYTDENGNEKTLDLGEAFDRMEKGTLPRLEPAVMEELRAKATAAGRAASVAPGTTAPTAPTAPSAQAPKPEGTPTEGGKPLTATPREPTPLPIGVQYDDQSTTQAKNDRKQYLRLGTGQGAAMLAPEYLKNTRVGAEAAREDLRQFKELAGILSKAGNVTGIGVAGTAFPERAALIGGVNTFIRALGGKGDVGDSPQVTQQLAEKIRTLSASARAREGGQESFAALEKLSNAIANPSMDKEAYSKLISEVMTMQRRLLDRSNHGNRYSRDADNVMQGAPSDFERLHPIATYDKEAKVIQNLMKGIVPGKDKPEPELFTALVSGKWPSGRPVTRKDLEEIGKRNGLRPGFSTYFMGGQ